jgi:hypothetical protein
MFFRLDVFKFSFLLAALDFVLVHVSIWAIMFQIQYQRNLAVATTYWSRCSPDFETKLSMYRMPPSKYSSFPSEHKYSKRISLANNLFKGATVTDDHIFAPCKLFLKLSNTVWGEIFSTNLLTWAKRSSAIWEKKSRSSRFQWPKRKKPESAKSGK